MTLLFRDRKATEHAISAPRRDRPGKDQYQTICQGPLGDDWTGEQPARSNLPLPLGDVTGRDASIEQAISDAMRIELVRSGTQMTQAVQQLPPGNVPARLEFLSRTAAVAWAIRNGLA